MEQVMKKAEVLIEALPYIQKFNRKIIVVKYGGSAMSNEELQKNVIKDVTLLKLVGFKPIIVHGGGKEISRWVGKVGKEAKFVNGLRVTDEETMEIAEMVLNKVNKSLVTMVEELGVKAVGVSGKDGGLLQVEKKYSDGQDIGYVGEITGVNPDILFDMLEKDYLPIIAPIGLDKDYHTYNINADDAACAIAKAVHAEKLAFLTDIEGLYKDINDKSTFISRLTASEAEGLIHDGYIGGGMLPKLNNCTSAIRNGVNRVHILDGRLAHCLLLEIFTNQGIGTAIVSDEEENKMSDTMKEYIAEAEKDLLHTYNRYQIVLDKGEGVHLYDTDGKKYLDFVAGIAVFALGYQNKAYNDALKAQIDKVIHTSNYYYNVPAIEAARKIKKVSGMDRVFFTNSGAEAVEGAIKAARKYAYLKDGCTDHEIIAMNHSFHGRTMGALSVTGNPKYREAFQPMIGHIKFAELNDFQSVLDQVTDKTCAIIMETVQGEGGLRPANEEFLKQVRDLCDERDILLILDEIQCGMGRTGYMYAWQRFGVKPDIMTSAKALGCGVPVGAFMMTEKVAQHSLTAGDHGTTYGGNPLACAAVEKVLDLFEEDHIIEHVREVAPYLEQRLNELADKYDCIKERRGVGLMQGLVFDHPVGDIINRALEKGLILINAGADIIRFVPPLVITRENVDEMITILDTCIE